MKKQANVVLSVLLCFVLLAATAVPAFAALGTVKNLKASAVTSTSVTLKWSKVSGASGYEIQKQTNGVWQSAAVTQKTTAKLTGLRLGTTYRYRVRAYATGGGVRYGTPSNAISVTAAPTVKNLKASAKTSYSVKLKWSKVSDAAGYRLQKYVDKQWVTVLKSTRKTTYTVKKLAPNTSYKFRVCAYTNGVFGAYKTLSVRTELLAKPTMLKATKVTDTSLTLDWAKVATAKKYYIYRVGPNTQKQIATTTKTSFKLTDLKPATDYMYAVRARTTVNDRNYYSQFSSYLSVRTAPKQATGLLVTGATDSSVNLRYSKVAGAEGYEIWKYNDATLKWECIGASETTRFTVADLSPQTVYRFKIRAYHTANGEKLCGAFSQELKAETKMAPVSDLKFTGATGTTLSFSWNPISTATAYRVDLREYDEPESAMRAVSADQKLVNGRMEAIVTTLKENTSYVICVRPVYGTVLGTEKYINATTAPAKVTDVTVKSVPGGISLSWPGVAGAQGYEVQKLSSGATWQSVGTTKECNFADSDVVTDVVYSYRVRAFYQLGGVKYYGAPSDSVSEKPLPPAVTGLVVSELSETSFRLTWNSPQTSTDYKVTVSENGGPEQALPAYVTISPADQGKMTLLVERLNGGSTYTVRIYNSVNGTMSMPSAVTVTTLPGVVTGVTANALSSSSVQLSWNNVRGALYYEVQQYTASGGAFVTVDNHVTGSACVVSGLQASTEYKFRVRAFNTNEGVAQAGAYSDFAVATTKAASADPQTPIAPTGLTATDVSSGSAYSAKLSWNGINGVSGYRVSINKGSKWETLRDVTTTTTTVSDLSAGTYQFYVQSYMGSGSTAVYSNPCTPVSITFGSTTPVTPDPPSGGDLPTTSTPISNLAVKLSNDGRTYTISWNEVSGAFYYVQMLDPATNQWTTVREKLTNPRATLECAAGNMGVSTTTNNDLTTTVGWGAVNGATGYEVRNEMAENTGDWIAKVAVSGTSASLRLPPNSKQTLRVSALGSARYRIYALNKTGTSALAYSEYTAQKVYMTCCDKICQTPAAPAFSSSAAVKEAYALMLTQAINNTRMEGGNVRMTAVTEQTATASSNAVSGGLSENEHTVKTITCNYSGGTGMATVTTKTDGKADETSTAFSMLSTIIVPSDGVTRLYDQHNLSTFEQYVSDVTVSQSGGKTVVTMKIKPENVTTSKDMVYHPGLMGATVTSENLEYIKSQSSSIQSISAKVGESTIKATINSSYTLDKLEISNPFVMSMGMRVFLTTVEADVNTALTYTYTFTR